MSQEIFFSQERAEIVVGLWQTTYNRVRPHLSLGDLQPAPVTFPDLTFQPPMVAKMQ
ncbi:integrase core domain-containing protein [Methylobacterium brachiatum]|uniref:integrase core domain-containing protein n=1 Tax=Methylobacterium brachiatum TaxID=269660 RepID=UPI0035229606|nr:integrase core domain-containing protein [Methylobacterium brachiatum]